MSFPFDILTDPPKKRRHRTPKKNLEGAVVRDCLRYLHDNDDVIYVERRNTGAVQLEGGGFIRFGSKGAADIWCLVKQIAKSGDGLYGYIAGRPPTTTRLVHVELEMKRADGKGRLSEDQKVFRDFCHKHDIPYFVITSVRELSEILNRF